MWISQGQTFTTVGNVVADLCSRAGLSAAQIDVSQLTDVLNGYCVTNHSTTRSNLGPLMSTYFFDACDSGGVIRFVKRGAQPAGTFLYADLGASPNLADTANTTPITETIAQEVDLPRSMQLTYPELGDDYNPNTQRAMRAYTNSNRDTVMQVPIVLAGSDALARTQAMLWSAWVGRKTFQFTTGLAYLQYEPGDVMTLQGANGESWIVRITRCQYDGQGSLLWAAALEGPDIYPGTSYTTQGGTALGFASQQIDYSGPTILSVLDIPPLRDANSTPGVYIAACGMASSWPGAAIDLSRDDVTFTQFAQIG
ncbi:phage tail protein [Burkholderia thailandensis]|uniref:phage tail protein n=1 Tax=Burkholderia thailandensis TaxID=57975 RepID=UPI0022AA7DEE|nr:phage tail protein [Burkholderia thailandensis]